MKVYIVFEYNGDADYVKKVFLSEDKAKEYIQYHGGTNHSYDEYDVDEPFGKGEECWEAEMYLFKKPGGNLIKCVKDWMGGRYCDTVKFYDGSRKRISIYVKAKTCEKAIEEANVRLERIIDEKDGFFHKVFIPERPFTYRRVSYLTGEYVDD